MEGSYHSPIVRILNAITTLYLTLSYNPPSVAISVHEFESEPSKSIIFLLNLYDLPVFLKFHSLFRPLGLILNGIISISVSLLRTGMIFKPTKIDPCANGNIYTYSCQCPETTFWNGEICENLPKCKNGLVLDSNYKCSCPQSFVWDRDSCVHSPCIGGQIWTGSNCTCPLGFNFNGSMCILCINGQIWDPRRLACFCEVTARWNGSYCVRTIDCFNGLVVDLTLKKCVCPEGTYWAGYRCI